MLELVERRLVGAQLYSGDKMARIKRLLGSGILAALLLLISSAAQVGILPAAAARPRPLSFAFDMSAYALQNPVEQQSPDFFFGPGISPQTWVYNLTGCVWDVDDNQVRYDTDGYVEPGVSVEDTLCVNADWAGFNYSGHLAGVSLWSGSADLLVTISFSPGGYFTAR